MLKFKISKLEEVDEKYRDLYEARDGAFYLKAEGAVDKARLDEFRDNNITLKKQVDELMAQFQGIDAEEARKLIKAAQEAKDKKMIEAGKMEELLAERTAAMKGEYEKQIKKLSDDLGLTSKQLEKLLVDNAITTEAAKAGVRDTAMEDVLLRGRGRYKVQNGAAVPMTPDGKVIYGKDGTTPETVTEWLAGLASNAPHLFNASSGGGARPGSGNFPPGTKVMKRTEFDQLTPDMKMKFSKEGGQITD